MELPDAIDWIRPCVVQIVWAIVALSSEQLSDPKIAKQVEAMPFPGTLGGILGTGFFVNDDGYVVSAAHVVDAAVKLEQAWRNNEIRLGFSIPYQDESGDPHFGVAAGRPVDGDRVHDLALLQTSGGVPFKRPFRAAGVDIDIPHAVVRLQQVRPRDGEAIACSGYPLNEAALVTNHGVVASASAADFREEPDPNNPGGTIRNIWPRYLGDMPTNPGNSGGPVYTVSDGSVIGVLVASKVTPVVAPGIAALFATRSALSVVVPSTFVVGLLERNSVCWTGPDGSVSTPATD